MTNIDTIALILPQNKPNYVNLIIEQLELLNFTVICYSWWDIESKNIFNINNNKTIMIADSENCPAFMQNSVEKYIQDGGNIVTLAGPPFSNEFYNINNNEVDIFTIKNMMSQGEFDKKIILPLNSTSDLEGFDKNTYNPDSKQYIGDASLSLCEDGAVSNHCIKYYTADFYINESFEKDISIDPNHNVIGFYAKSLQNTRTITLCLIEDNGNVFKLTFCPAVNFTYYIFTKRDFVYSFNRKGLEHSIRPEYVNFSKVVKVQFGHALSHAYSVAGEHAFFLEEFSSATIALLNDKKVSIDGLYPQYKFYPITNAVTIKSYSNQGFISENDFHIPTDLFSHSPRGQATGIDKNRKQRFIPLIECYDDKDIRCGYAAYMLKTNTSGTIVAFTTADYDFYKNSGAISVAQAIYSLYSPAVLIDGGTNEYIYFDDQNGNIGASVKLLGDVSKVTLKISYANTCLTYDIATITPTDNICKVVAEFIPSNTTVTIELFDNDILIDKLVHTVTIFVENPNPQFAYIKKDENEIYIGDQPVRFFGVNYMPSSSPGMDNFTEFEHYVAGFSYDPDVVETDLQRIAEIGMNSVSIFMHYNPSIHSNNILHLIDLCRKYNLYVDLSIRPHANPYDFSKLEVREMIQKYRFDKNDTIVAYDIAWERYVGTYDECYGNFNGRKSFNSDWNKFIINRYDSVENAELIWGCSVPRDENNSIIGVSDEMLRTDGIHTKMVASFRRFIDNSVALKHHKAMQFIKSIDPNHMISPRTGDASTIPLVDSGIYGYDYKALSSSMDFMSPESYALSDNYTSMRQGIFTNIYSRYANPDNVVQWKEFGKSIWTGSNFSDNSVSKEFQAEYYRRFFDMLITGHTSGLYAWWWAGGYRIGENSDFGIVEPDGSDRPVTKVFRDYVQTFLNAPKLKANPHQILINRDLHSDGLLSMYNSIEKELFSKLESGEMVEFIDGSSDTNSTNVDLVEVGGGTSKYVQSYLDYIITDITALCEDKSTISIENYGCVPINSTIKFTLLNTQNSTWVCGDNFGSVSLISLENSNIDINIPLSNNVAYLESYTFTFPVYTCGNVNLMLNVQGRTRFGEKITITVK